MKVTVVTIFFFICTNLIGQLTLNQNFYDLVEAEAKAFNHKKSITNKGVPQSANYDLKYHRLEWQIDPEIFYITGAVTSYFEPVVAGFNEIYFDFSNALTIDSIVYNGSNLSYTQPVGDILQVSLPSVLPQATLDSLTIYYQGAPVPTSGFGSFIQSSHNGDSIIWTLSEPYGSLEWWPCKQNLNDKIDSIDVIVTTPSKNRVGSQGLLVSENSIGPNKIYHWKHRYPIPSYLISVAITNYAAYTEVAPLSTGNLNVLNYVFPEDSLSATTQTWKIIPMLQLYDTMLGPYPFSNEKYGHAQFGWNGGMEHQTMSSMANFSFSLQAHELAHQWVGDKVTCGSWNHIWLNEGFATYMTGLAHKYIDPFWWYGWKQGTRDAVTAQPDGSVFNPDTVDVNRIFDGRLTYSKGAFLVHMLSWKLGEDTLFQGIRNYLNDPNYAYGYAVTDHLKAHLESVSGQNLTEFFNDWFYGEGHPTYQIIWTQAGNLGTFTINQTQSHPSVSFYEMPIPVYVKGQGQDTTYVFDNQFNGQVFNVNVPFTIDSVFFDPEIWILAGTPSILSVDEVELYDGELIIYPNPTKGLFQIQLSKSSTVNEIKVFNAIGQQVKSVVTPQSNNLFELDIQHLPKGNYVVEVKLDDTVIRRKLNKI